MAKSLIIKPPTKIPDTKNKVKIFLAGTIDMGNSVDWQSVVEKKLFDDDVIVFNPRRNFWNCNWKEDTNDSNFNEQVNWELDALEISDIIIFYFAPNSKSPISLLELGLFIKSEKHIFICAENYYKKGNIDIVSKRNNIKTYESLDDIIDAIKLIIK